MKATVVLCIVLVCIWQLSTPVDGNVIGNCFATWSRCSRWSRWFTGRAWKNCNDRCRELGKSGGSCVLTPSTCPITSEAWQCRCY